MSPTNTKASNQSSSTATWSWGAERLPIQAVRRASWLAYTPHPAVVTQNGTFL